MKTTLYHGGCINTDAGFSFWTRAPGQAENYSDGESLMMIEIDLSEMVEDGIQAGDVADLDNDEILVQQYERIADLLADGASAVGCDDGIAIPNESTADYQIVSIDRAYEIYEEAE